MTVVTFTDYLPTPRFDNTPWTVIHVEEAPDPTAGPWTLIDTIQIYPVDLDPSSPDPRSFTTDKATLTAGWYRITFLDQQANAVVSDPIQNIPPVEENWFPSVKDVALKILSRTRDNLGNQLGTFTDDTIPTAQDVSDIIRQASLDVAKVLGDQIPVELYDDVANLIAQRAAMQVELSYYSEQIVNARSAYPDLEKDYELELPILSKQVSQVLAGGMAGPEALGPSLTCSFNFPPVDPDWMRKRW